MNQKLQVWWDDRSSDEKAKIKKFGAGAILISSLFATYYLSGQNEKVEPPKVIEEEISSDANLLEADIRTKVDKDLKYMNDQLVDVNKTNNERFNALESLLKEIAAENSSLEAPVPSQGEKELSQSSGVIEYPPIPQLPPSFSQVSPASASSNATVINSIQVEPQIIGSIGHAEGVTFKKTSGKKKEKRLPAAFIYASEAPDWHRRINQ